MAAAHLDAKIEDLPEGAKMLITIDVGNTHIVIGIYDADRLIHHWRISTDSERTTDEYGVMLTSLLQGAGLKTPLEPEGVVVACVVPPLNPTFEQLSERYFHCDPLVVLQLREQRLLGRRTARGLQDREQPCQEKERDDDRD